MEFFHTHVSLRAVELATDTLRSGWISEGARVKEFEEALARRLGLSRPVAVNSGTAALHLALAITGVGPGDEVILPAQTFVATGMAVLMQGATPVFADVDPRTGNVTPEAMRAAVTERTRALLPVHWAGYPCDLKEIAALASEYDLTVVEDAAHALGATYRGQPVGALSRFTCFSFQAIKHLTTGDGGVLACRREADEQGARRRRWFGIDRARSRPSPLGERIYELEEVGFKYHMNDLAAAVGLGNLEDFPVQLTRRQAIGAYYRAELAAVPGLDLFASAADRTHAYWLFPVLVERREDFVRKLAAAGVPTSVVHLSIDRYEVFRAARTELPGQAELNSRQVHLPLHAALTDQDLERIVTAVRAGW